MSGEVGTAGRGSSARFGSVLDAMREGFQVIGPDFRYLYVNDAACAQGQRPRDELLGHTMMECYPGIEHTPLFDVLRRCLATSAPETLHNEFTFPDGTHGWFDLRIQRVPEGVAILSIDVTEHHRLEQQYRHAQKMEAVGRLAGGVAHDFNNILTAILTFGQFARDALPEEHGSRADLDEVLNAAHRAEVLVRQLLAFSRKQRLHPQVVDVNELVRNLASMITRVIGEDVELRTTLSPSVGRVYVDTGAFEQVLVNLAVNARDAMPHGGRLTIETGNATLDRSVTVARGAEVEPGDYVMVSVADTGHGMDADTARRLFEPYFTTKVAGRGTGLGLSTCYGIVRQADGHIWVYSEPGTGSLFKVYLPRVQAEVTSAAPPAPAPSVGGDETVLVVEDDPVVQRLVVRALERSGYTVLAAGTGQAALALCRDAVGAIHLVLSDVILPGIDGPKLAAQLRDLQPGLRVVFMSGYGNDHLEDALGPDAVLLEKPFTTVELTACVRAVLDA